MEVPTPVVSTHGNVRNGDVRYAIEKLEAAAKIAPAQITHATIRLQMEENPAIERPARAEATLDLGRRVVRASVAAASMHEAVDSLEARLRRQFQDIHERIVDRRRHHGHWAETRPNFIDLPVEDRDVVKRKSFAVDVQSPDEAAFDMDALDHAFYLFTCAETGADALIERDDEGGYVVTSRTPVPAEVIERSAVPVSNSKLVPADLDLAGARELLHVEAVDHIFFTDSTSGRGHVLYRRFDGNYGLIVPSDEKD